MFVTMGEGSIQFTLEKDWAEGTPAIEGTPLSSRWAGYQNSLNHSMFLLKLLQQQKLTTIPATGIANKAIVIKTLLHLIVKKISLNDKHRVKDIELTFNEETEKHFLNIAPSADSTADGAFLISRKAPILNQSLYIVI
ncbi:hypothetical protein J2T12_004308 [Paenibacillus anaericanus]|uniref:hypothetical protein n=1 Tax=Paenibacillus anaericanus TaxID=170367 RepID=UPI0027807159|nr:hypothetical protein [Paenibacillus anaericanus]MDQ0090882.1 hypothetical protein [Paenibacillus anaericanus]